MNIPGPGGPTVPCPRCKSTGATGLFGRNQCGLCDGRAYLFSEPYKCAACSGRGRRRERGAFLEAQCGVCRGIGYTRKKLLPCALCDKRWSFFRGGDPCHDCGDSGWVDGRQAPCIVCKVYRLRAQARALRACEPTARQRTLFNSTGPTVVLY